MSAAAPAAVEAAPAAAGAGVAAPAAGQVVSVQQLSTKMQRSLPQLKAKTSRGQSVACGLFLPSLFF